MSLQRKLIEVALPLEAINVESAREKSIRHGHPSTLHIWWARRPLAACRAVLFASLVDDPSEYISDEAEAEQERQRLFRIIEQLVRWENSSDKTVLDAARREILRCTKGAAVRILDPFCGGGSIPLEAQRLGLETQASDLNPVAVLLTKALVEIPARFAARPAVNPGDHGRIAGRDAWNAASGLAADIRFYGRWMRDEAERRVGHMYPKIRLPKDQGGSDATVIAWLWARTVVCPNPACRARMPLVRSLWLSTKKGKEAWTELIVDHSTKIVRFEPRTGTGGPAKSPKLGRGANFQCAICHQVVDEHHIKDEGIAKRLGMQLMAIVAEGPRRRVYLAPVQEHSDVAESAVPSWRPEEDLAYDPRNIWCTQYGLTKYGDLFTPRQLVTLGTLVDLVQEAREKVLSDSVAAGLVNDKIGLNAGGTGANAYADAVATYLAFAVDKAVDRSSTICTWDSSPKMEALRNTFARQAIPMTWDFAEGNPFSDSSGNWMNNVEWTALVVDHLAPAALGRARQLDATAAINGMVQPLVSTDPPYYDNIGYAALSDFFYVWLRRTIGKSYPDLFSTVLTPKAEELVADPYRFGGDREEARRFFEKGLGQAFARIRESQHPEYPMTLFYAFKQAEADDRASRDGDVTPIVTSTGWETMLEGLLNAGFGITGTWPIRSELGNRTIARGTNALASSIVLVCRPRPTNAPITTRRDFLTALKHELPGSLKRLQHGNIAPVDLAQAALGPGMAVFSRYSRVVEADGAPMAIRTALGLINQSVDEVLAEQENEYDAQTRWAVAWFDQFGVDEGPYGTAEILSKAKDIGIAGLGFVLARMGKVRLLRRDELPVDWDPAAAYRFTVWEATQHLIRALQSQGEPGAAALAARMGALGEVARDLSYRLYMTAERKGWTQEALAYNSLVVAWPEISRLASQPALSSQESYL